MSALRPLVLLVCVVVAGLVVPRLATAASIRGIVTVTGAVTPKKLPVTIDQYVCGTEKPGEDLIVSWKGRVKHAVERADELRPAFVEARVGRRRRPFVLCAQQRRRRVCAAQRPVRQIRAADLAGNTRHHEPRGDGGR